MHGTSKSRCPEGRVIKGSGVTRRGRAGNECGWDSWISGSATPGVTEAPGSMCREKKGEQAAEGESTNV